MSVRHIMSDKGRDVVTAGADATLAEIAAILFEKRIGAVVITEGEAIRGIVSERDIVRALATVGADALDKPVRETMTQKVVTCTGDDTVDELMEKMTSGRFRHVPVVEDGKLAGIISIGDVVKARIEEVEREARDIRQYITAG